MDLDKVRELAELMGKYGLGEVCVEEDDEKVVLKKAVAPAPAVWLAPPAGSPPVPNSGAAQPPTAENASAAPATPPPPSAPPAESGMPVKAPLVGTFYRSSSPDSDPFVKVGDRVGKDSVVCIIEAMKVMNEVKAEKSGIIKEVLVENGDPVEYGQKLFVIG